MAERITETPDIIIGIARGGVIPAVLLSKLLEVKDLYVLKVWREGEERRIIAEIFTNVSGKKVLVVEDMLETGKRLTVAREYLESKGASVQTACFYTMPMTKVQPNFFLREVQEVQRFPWE